MDMGIAAVITVEHPVPATKSLITAIANIMGAMAAATADRMAMGT